MPLQKEEGLLVVPVLIDLYPTYSYTALLPPSTSVIYPPTRNENTTEIYGFQRGSICDRRSLLRGAVACYIGPAAAGGEEIDMGIYEAGHGDKTGTVAMDGPPGQPGGGETETLGGLHRTRVRPRAYVARPHGGTSAALTSPPSSAASEHSHADHAVGPHHAGGHA